jgi:hypothetical protein
VSLDLTGQDLIEKAVKEIDAALARDPWDWGEPRSRLNRRLSFTT